MYLVKGRGAYYEIEAGHYEIEAGLFTYQVMSRPFSGQLCQERSK